MFFFGFVLSKSQKKVVVNIVPFIFKWMDANLNHPALGLYFSLNPIRRGAF